MSIATGNNQSADKAQDAPNYDVAEIAWKVLTHTLIQVWAQPRDRLLQNPDPFGRVLANEDSAPHSTRRMRAAFLALRAEVARRAIDQLGGLDLRWADEQTRAAKRDEAEWLANEARAQLLEVGYPDLLSLSLPDVAWLPADAIAVYVAARDAGIAIDAPEVSAEPELRAAESLMANAWISFWAREQMNSLGMTVQGDNELGQWLSDIRRSPVGVARQFATHVAELAQQELFRSSAYATTRENIANLGRRARLGEVEATWQLRALDNTARRAIELARDALRPDRMSDSAVDTYAYRLILAKTPAFFTGDFPYAAEDLSPLPCEPILTIADLSMVPGVSGGTPRPSPDSDRGQTPTVQREYLNLGLV